MLTVSSVITDNVDITLSSFFCLSINLSFFITPKDSTNAINNCTQNYLKLHKSIQTEKNDLVLEHDHSVDGGVSNL